MLPSTNYEEDIDIREDFEEEILPNKTYKLDFNHNIVDGIIDDLEAKKQAIIKIILTEAEEYLIYDEQYGCMLRDLIGMMPSYVKSEAKDRIAEAILNDDRFVAVDFTGESCHNHTLTLSMTITCADGGKIDLEEVEIDV